MSPEGPVPLSGLSQLRQATPARVALARSGLALATAPVLDFRAAHARARDAVYALLDGAKLALDVAPFPTLAVSSEANDRSTFLRRPDLGRRLDPGSFEVLPQGPFDIALICADGLSAMAVQTQAPIFIAALRAALAGLTFSPLVIAIQGRVALADDVGERMRARLALIMIGERPGLSVADSMGIYLTYSPKRGRRDAERNCISNIHAEGLSPAAAAAKAAWLIENALARSCTGIALKDEQPAITMPDNPAPIADGRSPAAGDDAAPG